MPSETSEHLSNEPASLADDESFVLLTDLRPLVPLHPQHIRKLIKKGAFPKPLKIGAQEGRGGRTAFRRRDVIAWARQQQ